MRLTPNSLSQETLGRGIAAIKDQGATAHIGDQGSGRATITDLQRSAANRGAAGVSVVASEDEGATLALKKTSRTRDLTSVVLSIVCVGLNVQLGIIDDIE